MFLLGQTGICEFLEATKKPTILSKCIIKNEMKSNNIKTITDLVESENVSGELLKIKNSIPTRLYSKLYSEDINRDETTQRRLNNKIPIKANIFRDINKLKYREIFLTNYENDDDEGPNPFTLARKIKHPKERFAHYMSLQRKTYTNEKLHRLKLINSNKCSTCTNQIETIDHILLECPRSEIGWKIFEDISNTYLDEDTRINGPKNIKHLNLYSLIKRDILMFRDQPLKEELLRHRCNNRLNDLRKLTYRYLKDKDTNKLKQDLLKTEGQKLTRNHKSRHKKLVL